MSEIVSAPYKILVRIGDNIEECDAFGPQHSLADIARWILQNKTEAQELVYILTEALEHKYLSTSIH